jgi:D-Tyr-tRNAtyr deacylase
MQTTAAGAHPAFSTAAGPEEALALFQRLALSSAASMCTPCSG